MARTRTIGASQAAGGVLAQAWLGADDAAALQALARRMKVSRSEIMRTGIKVMLARARQLGLLPLLPGEKIPDRDPERLRKHPR